MRGVAKFQQGGGIRIARVITDKELGQVPIDIKMPSTDISGVFKTKAPVKSMPKTLHVQRNQKQMTDTPPVGFNSDVRYAMNMVYSARKKLSDLAMNGKQGTSAWNSATEQLNRGLVAWKNTKNLQSDFNKVIKQDKLDSSALAIYGNMAFVYDRNTNSNAIVPTSSALSVMEGGRPRYAVLTVTDALNARKGNSEFSGFTDKGNELTSMLINLPNEGYIDKELKNAFKSSGFKAGNGTVLYTPTGKTSDAATIISLINGTDVAKDTLGSEKYKTNIDALKSMQLYFRNKIDSDTKLHAAMRARATAQLMYTDPTFYSKSYKEKNIAIENSVSNMVQNSIAANIKTTFGDALKAKLNQSKSVTASDLDVAKNSQGIRAPIDINGSQYKVFGEVITPMMVQLPDALHILSEKQDVTKASTMDNALGLSRLSEEPLSQSVRTFTGDKVVDVAGGDLGNVEVVPGDGAQILHGMPTIIEKGSPVIDTTFIHLKADLKNKEAEIVASAYSQAVGEKSNYMIDPNGPETYGNLKDTKKKKLLKLMKNLPLYKELSAHVAQYNTSYRDLVKFNVLINVRTGFIRAFSSGDDDKYITPENKRGYYKEMDDEAFDSGFPAKASKPTGPEHVVYKTAAYMALGTGEYTNKDYPTHTISKEQIKRNLKASKIASGVRVDIEKLL